MSDILKQLYNNCDPRTPATQEFYVDCSDVRGGNALVWRFREELREVKGGTYLCFLFSGHIGGGKSSELEHLRHKLEAAYPQSGHERYLPIVLDMEEYLDEYDVTPTDILIAVVAEVAAVLREKEGIELKDGYITKRWDELKKYVLSDVEINEAEIPIWEAKAKIQRLRVDPTAREKVRANLIPQTKSLLEEINLVFDRARLELKKKASNGSRYADIVLILDNLEKIQRLTGYAPGEASQRALFLESAPQLTGMNAHVIYTIPLRLVRACGGQLNQAYGRPPFVLPMIKTATRGDHAPYEAGRARLRELLQKRVAPEKLERVFTEEALDWILRYSGGSVRELMKFAREASIYADALPIGLKEAKQSLSQTIQLYSTSIKSTHWPKMARLERSDDQHIDNDDTDFQEMLEQVTVMEYINGGDEHDLFADNAPWYAVNPIVRELRQFKNALASFDAVRPPAPPA